MSIVEKELSELDNFEVVDLNDSAWSWGRGGRPLYNDEHFISHTVFDDDIADDGYEETRYKLPEFMNVMLRIQEKSGSDNAKKTIRNALSI